MRRGEIWWASLGRPRGSGPGYRRPVLVIQSDEFNRSRIATVVVAVLTTNLDLARAPGNVLLRKKTTGLPRDSVVNVSQILTLDKSLLDERVARLPARRMSAVDEGIRLVLDIAC